MNSGLDTEAIITELASARSVKVQNIEKEKTKLSWKIDAWKELNTKIYSLYSDVISDMRFDYAYTKKKTTASNADVVTIQTAGDAMNGVQTLKVNKLAKTGFLTGAQLDASSGEKLLANMDGMDWLKDANKSVTFKVKIGDEEKEIKLSGYDNLNAVAEKFKAIGLDAKYDENTHRFFIASKETGKAANFTMSAATQSELGVPGGLQKVPPKWEDLKDKSGLDETTYKNERDGIIAANNSIIKNNPDISKKLGLKESDGADLTDAQKDEILARNNAIIESEENIKASNAESSKNFIDTMKALGMLTADMAKEYGVEVSDEDKLSGKYATKIEGQDAEIELNGAQFTSSKNVFEINGLTMTVHKETTDPITLTTEQDTDGIYDVVKNFIKKYSELINEMDKLYNAESASKYEPLTKEEKDALSDTEVEEWEKKIKDSLLRRDSTLSSVSSALKTVMLQTHIPGREGVNDGKDIYLSYFGIETLGYFKSKDNEKNAYHINGDSDDTEVKNYENKLKKAIATDPDTVIEFFKELATNLYNTLEDKMGRTDYSSSFTVYNDKQMATELKEYDSKISTEQKKLNDYIDRWYEKFSQMEVALSKLNSKESSISSLFG